MYSSQPLGERSSAFASAPVSLPYQHFAVDTVVSLNTQR